MKEYNSFKYLPFKTLNQKINYIKRTNPVFGQMKSKDGNDEMDLAIKNVVKYILYTKKFIRKDFLDLLKNEWHKVYVKYPEAYSDTIISDVYWYINPCLEYRGKREVTKNEKQIIILL
jgi:hypothetical protein